MENSATEPDMAADSGERLARIQEMLEKNEALRKQRMVVSLVGMAVLLSILVLFLYRLKWLGEDMIAQSPDTAKVVWEESQPVVEAELKALSADFKDKVIPELSQSMRAAFEREMPKFESEAREMGGRLYEHSTKDVEAKLIEALGKSLEASGDELATVFPKMSAPELEASLKKSGDLFVDRSYEVIELHISRVSASIDGLKGGVKKVAESRGADQLDAQRLDWAEEEVISALTDLVVYELKPALGEQPANSGQGGDK
jgi:hypothetical protein